MRLGRAAPVSRQNGGEFYPSGQFVASFSALRKSRQDSNFALIPPQNFRSRTSRIAIQRHGDYSDELYALSATAELVDTAPLVAHCSELKQRKPPDWPAIPSFSIFHRGTPLVFFVLAHWGNDNEPLLALGVCKQAAWQRAEQQYTCCVRDMAVHCFGGHCLVHTRYTGKPDIRDYRARFFTNRSDL